MSNRQLHGVVTEFDGRFFHVLCPDAPPHLTDHRLRPSEMKGAEVGHRVTLAYFSTRTYGFWHVISVDREW